MKENKQYFVSKSYGDYYYIVALTNGSVDNAIVVSEDEIPDYIFLFEGYGYKRAYFAPDIDNKIKAAKETLENLQKQKEEAEKNPLIISDEDAAYYFPGAF